MTTRIKTDGTPYVHNRTKERYLARHAGLMKIGHVGTREGWTECVMYQKADKPSEWFCRDQAAFCEQFTEERELAIQAAGESLGINVMDMPHGRIENWFVMPKGQMAGDITEHDHDDCVKQDYVSNAKIAFIDKTNRFAIVDGTVFELVGDEVVIEGQ